MTHRRHYPGSCRPVGPNTAPVRFFAPVDEDEDIKIYGGGKVSGAAVPAEDDGAAEFIREKENGNLQRAKQLGTVLGRRLRHLWRFGDMAQELQQKKILYTFVASKIIKERCPGSLLAQAALAEFSKVVQAVSQQDYDSIQDSLAFTKYLLSQRKDVDAVGQTFADLCGQKDDVHLKTKGIQLYYRYTSDCLKLFNQFHFQ